MLFLFPTEYLGTNILTIRKIIIIIINCLENVLLVVKTLINQYTNYNQTKN